MCRADVEPQTVAPLARLLNDIAEVLAADAGVPRDEVRIGPVDFGPENAPTPVDAPGPRANETAPTVGPRPATT